MSADRRLDAPRIGLLGTSAMLFDAPGAFDLTVQQRIWAMAREAALWPEVLEAMPGMTNLMLTFATPPTDPAALQARLLRSWEASEPQPAADSKLVEIPVIYGGERGPDLASVAAQAGLTPTEAAELHAAADYVVYTVGSSPGFGYLGGLNEQLFVPRRAVPLLWAGGGSVMIAGQQAGVTTAGGPTGWHVLGHSTAPLFDAMRNPPALLRAGDRVRFRIAGIEA